MLLDIYTPRIADYTLGQTSQTQILTQPILKSHRLQEKVDPNGKSTQREEITLKLSTLSGKNRTQSIRYQTRADDPLFL